jgi:hypothetical protein
LLADEVLAAVRDHGLPAIRARMQARAPDRQHGPDR